MPDISQIVPLASVFGVSTDVLFDMSEKSESEFVNEIINETQDMVYDEHGVATVNGLYQAYQNVRKALVSYPNNISLLMNCLEMGIGLSNPESILYDPVHGKDIYNECIRHANLVIYYDKKAHNILRAHAIMAILHSYYGNYDSAVSHAKQFPYRVDMNIHKMYAFINHATYLCERLENALRSLS